MFRFSLRPATTLWPPVLLGSQFVFNIGFYAVVPFLAIFLRDDMLLSGGLISSFSGCALSRSKDVYHRRCPFRPVWCQSHYPVRLHHSRRWLSVAGIRPIAVADYPRGRASRVLAGRSSRRRSKRCWLKPGRRARRMENAVVASGLRSSPFAVNWVRAGPGGWRAADPSWLSPGCAGRGWGLRHRINGAVFLPAKFAAPYTVDKNRSLVDDVSPAALCRLYYRLQFVAF